MKLNIKKLSRADYLKILIPVLYGLAHYFVRSSVMGSLFYILGWYFGMVLLILDKEQLYRYYYESIHLKDDKLARVITRSLLFIIAYFGLSLFIVTSSGNNFGVGIVMGIGLILAFELWYSRLYIDFFNQYFVQSKKLWNGREIDNFVKVFLAFYLFISIFSVI